MGGFGILILVGILIVMPKFQAVREIKVSESISNIYSITHAYERSQIANRETIESLLINSSIEFGRKGGGLDIKWDRVPDREELKQNLLEDIEEKIENNGGRDNFFRTIYFKDGYMDTAIVGDDNYRMNIDTGGNLNVFLKSYCPQTVGSGDVSQVNFEKKHRLSVGFPVRYFRTYEKVKDFIEVLKKDFEDDGKINFKAKSKSFNEKNGKEGFEVSVSNRKSPLKFAILDLRNNITYSDHYGPYVFNVSLEIPEVSKPCIVTDGKCERGEECTFTYEGKSEDVEWIFDDESIESKKSREITVTLPDNDQLEIKLSVDEGETVVSLGSEETKLEDSYGSCS